MQLVGIGFARSHWNSLVNRLQKQVSHQLNSTLFGESLSDSAAEIHSKESPDTAEGIVKLKPDWILFSSAAFETPETCIKLLQEVQNRSKKNVRHLMAIDKIYNDFASYLKLQPVFELVNKMRFKIYDPELLLTHHIRSFPRIRLGTDFKTMDYTDNSGTLVRQSPSEVPLNTLIPFKNIQKIETENTKLAPEEWLHDFLLKRGSVAHPEQVVGILREEKGCYLFPGIPFNSIQSLKFEKTKIEHVIRLDECTIKNPPFKRFIESMNQEHQTWLNKKKEYSKHASTPVHCLCKYSIINALLKKLLKEIGHTNVKIITEMSSSEQVLKNSGVWLKMNDFPKTKFQVNYIDWSKDLNQIIEPLGHFIFLNDLQLGKKLDSSPLQQVEFEKIRDNLLNEVKDAETKIQQAESNQMLYTQERDVLKKIEPFSKRLLEALSTSLIWGNAVENAEEIKIPSALLLCKDEYIAAELNLSLTEITRKLWINPFKYQNAEDLTQLNTKMILSYLKPGTIIITTAARRHLENICCQALQQGKKSETVFREQKQIIKQFKTNLGLLHNKKNQLAVRWLHLSLKQLLYRDRLLFQTLPDKTE